VNKSKARRERKFNLDLYRKVQVEYAKTVREISRPVFVHRDVEVELLDRTLPYVDPADRGNSQ
jgi:hypothetical protein